MTEPARANIKNISMDEFAEMMMREFIFTRKTLGDKIDRLEVRMDRVESRLDKLEVRMDRLEKRFTVLEKRVGGLEVKVGNMEMTMATKADIARLDKKFDAVYSILSDHSVRISRLERLKLA
jgi:predicted nuclease with TOPRIM domain